MGSRISWNLLVELFRRLLNPWAGVGAALVFSICFLRSQFTWASFPRSSLKLKLLKEGTTRHGLWTTVGDYVGGPTFLTTYYSLWAVLLTVFPLAVLSSLLTAFSSQWTGSLDIVWQAHVTVMSLSFIVIVFLLDHAQRMEYQEGVMRRFLAKSGALPVLYYSLATAVIIGGLYVGPLGLFPSTFAVSFAGILFVGMVMGISYVYYKTARMIFEDPLDELRLKEIEYAVGAARRQDERQTLVTEIIEDEFESVTVGGFRSPDASITAHEIDLVERCIEDIDLDALEQICRAELQRIGSKDIRFQFSFKLTGRFGWGEEVVYLEDPTGSVSGISDAFREGIAESIVRREAPRWLDAQEAIDRNLDELRDSSRQAIEKLSLSGLKRYLETYERILEIATRPDRRSGGGD